jgi:hypothetical protein
MSAIPTDLIACPNCGAPLAGAFCARCGQKVAPINPTLHDFLHDAVHEFLHVDGRVFRSVKDLLLWPGWLTREYSLGRRASYLTAIRLYLIFSVLYFAVVAIAPGSALTVRVGSTGSAEDAAELQRLGYASEEELQEAVVHAFQVWIPRVMFALVPIFASLVMITNWRARRNYPEHLIFAMHVHAAWFCAAALVTATKLANNGSVSAVVGTVGVLYGAWYFVRALKTVYNTTTAGAIWRAAVVATVYVVAIAGAMAAIVVPLVVER